MFVMLFKKMPGLFQSITFTFSVIYKLFDSTKTKHFHFLKYILIPPKLKTIAFLIFLKQNFHFPNYFHLLIRPDCSGSLCFRSTLGPRSLSGRLKKKHFQFLSFNEVQQKKVLIFRGFQSRQIWLQRNSYQQTFLLAARNCLLVPEERLIAGTEQRAFTFSNNQVSDSHITHTQD